MGAPSTDNVFRVPGRLIKGASSTSGPNYGGTVLGAVNKCQLRDGTRYVRQYFDELGRTGEVWQTQGDTIFEVNLRGWDADALAAFFPAYSGAVASIGGSLGPMAATDATSYLYVPDRPTEHPAVFLPNAIPMLEANETSFRFSILYELNLSIFLLALPSSTSNLISAKVGLASAIIS